MTDGRLTVIDDGGALAIAGEVDLETSPQLETELERVIASGTDDVVLDLAGVTFLDSAGLNVLVRTYKRITPSGRGLVLRAANDQIRRVLEIGGATKFATLD